MNNTISKKINNLYTSLEPLCKPSKFDCFIYLLIPLYLILFLFKKLPPFIPHIDMLYIKFLISLFGVTYTYKNLSPYIRNITNFKTTVTVSAKLFVVTSICTYLALLVVGRDPQNIGNLSLTNTQYYLLLLDLPFTAIGEEVFKVLMLLAFLRLFAPLKNNKFIVSLLLSSFIFGLLHINYNYASSLKIIFAIGVTAIPSFLFFLYYKSIYPSIIVHFFLDFMAFSNVSTNYSFIVLFFQLALCTAISLLLLRQFFNLAFNKNKS